MNLYLLRDFAEAYAAYTRPRDPDDLPDPNVTAAVKLTEVAVSLGAMSVELQAFGKAKAMLAGELADEDRPMVERLRANAALRFARKLALLPPTEKTRPPGQ
jgi:hypothetical protein